MEQIFKKLKGVILVKADFYKIKKKKCSSREPAFANFLTTYFH